ncbi:hypothetical protein H4R33_002642 [Dimargaris cristalligena]|nr:hypothetical protein H4R33_002642 [Dimargaris cristalligena]
MYISRLLALVTVAGLLVAASPYDDSESDSDYDSDTVSMRSFSTARSDKSLYQEGTGLITPVNFNNEWSKSELKKNVAHLNRFITLTRISSRNLAVYRTALDIWIRLTREEYINYFVMRIHQRCTGVARFALARHAVQTDTTRGTDRYYATYRRFIHRHRSKSTLQGGLRRLINVGSLDALHLNLHFPLFPLLDDLDVPRLQELARAIMFFFDQWAKYDTSQEIRRRLPSDIRKMLDDDPTPGRTDLITEFYSFMESALLPIMWRLASKKRWSDLMAFIQALVQQPGEMDRRHRLLRYGILLGALFEEEAVVKFCAHLYQQVTVDVEYFTPKWKVVQVRIIKTLQAIGLPGAAESLCIWWPHIQLGADNKPPLVFWQQYMYDVGLFKLTDQGELGYYLLTTDLWPNEKSYTFMPESEDIAEYYDQNLVERDLQKYSVLKGVLEHYLPSPVKNALGSLKRVKSFLSSDDNSVDSPPVSPISPAGSQ